MATFMGVPQLAEALRVDQSTIHRRIARGELVPDTFVGKRAFFLVDLSELEKTEAGVEIVEPKRESPIRVKTERAA